MPVAEARRPLVDPTREVAPRRPRIRRSPTSRLSSELASAAGLAVALLAAYSGLHVLLQDLSWYLVGSLFIVLVLAAANIARRLVRSPWLPTVIAAAVALLALTVGYAADRALLGVIPTPGAVARFARLSGEGWRSIAEQSLPARPELGIVFLLALLTAGCALFGDLVLRRAPALTVIPLLTMLAVPVAVRAGLSDPFWYVVTAVAYLLLIRRGRRVPASTAIVAAVVVVGSLVAPLLLPSVPRSTASGALGPGIAAAANPLVNLGGDLRRGGNVTAATYTTSSGQGVYLRLATLDRFDGRQWAPDTAEPAARNTVDDFPPPAGLTSAVGRERLSAKVQVWGIAGRRLPVPYPASDISGLTGTWRWERGGLSVRSTDSDARGQTYEAGFLDVQPDLRQLRAATTSGGSPVGDLGLPSGMPSIIANTARRVTVQSATEYDQALALQDYFTSSGGFSYSETAPVAQGYDGTGAQIIAEFLRKKTGYCVHFASSMAVMARTLGIPARVVVGFQPGEASLTADGGTVFTVGSDDLHAWPELYFRGIGWLRFEPTPGRGELPLYSQPAAVDDAPVAGGDAATATADPSASPAIPGKLTKDGGDASAGSGSAASGAGGTASGLSPSAGTLIGVAVVVLVLLLPAGVRIGIRRRRMRAIARGRDPAAAAWAEVRDTARDHGWSAPDTETPRAFADRLAGALVSDAAAIGGLRRSVESASYGREAAPISPAELRAVRRAIASASDARERMRAVLLPPSLIARARRAT